MGEDVQPHLCVVSGQAAAGEAVALKQLFSGSNKLATKQLQADRQLSQVALDASEIQPSSQSSSVMCIVIQ